MSRNGQKTAIGAGGWGRLPIDNDLLISSLESLWKNTFWNLSTFIHFPWNPRATISIFFSVITQFLGTWYVVHSDLFLRISFEKWPVSWIKMRTIKTSFKTNVNRKVQHACLMNSFLLQKLLKSLPIYGDLDSLRPKPPFWFRLRYRNGNWKLTETFGGYRN